MTDSCGTPAYIAPEVINGTGYQGFYSDIWSAGVVLYAMIYGAVPFKAQEIDDLYDNIRAAKFTLKPDSSIEVWNLITWMLERIPSDRIKIHEILTHPWMKDVEHDLDLLNDSEK